MGTAFTCVLLGSLASATVFDLRERRIPNRLVLFMIVGWLVLLVGVELLGGEGARVGDAVVKGLGGAGLLGGGALVMGLVYEGLRGQPSLGGGDVKLLFALGLYLGPWGGVLCLMVACLGAVVLGFVIPRTAFASGPQAQPGQIPFAPALFLGALVAVWFS